MSETKTIVITERSTMGLREILFAELDALRSGQIEPVRAHATAKLAQQILTSVALELNAVRWLEENGKGAGFRTAPKLKLVS